MDRVATWLRRLAAILFVVSLVLPTARVGPPADRPALGLFAALLSGFLLPLSVEMLADPPPASAVSRADLLYTVAAGMYFGLLLLQNGVFVYGLLAARAPHAKWARRLATAAAILPWAVPFLDYARVYRALTLASTNVFELKVGFFVWAGSFALLAIALRVKRRPA
jgi:hypothetical protein